MADRGAEEATSWAEIPWLGSCVGGGGVYITYQLLHDFDLPRQFLGGEFDGWFIMHSVVAEFMTTFYQILQRLFSTRDVRADEEERGFCAMSVQNMIYLRCVWRGPIIYRQG